MPRLGMAARGFGSALALALFFTTSASAGLVVTRDAYCYTDTSRKTPIGVVLANTEVEAQEQAQGMTRIFSERHAKDCWISDKAFEERGYIHPADLERTMQWQTLVERWLPDFPDLTTELVLSVVYKETVGDPHAVDATGNDIRLVGAASVGLMGAIPRPHLPCYQTLTSAGAEDAYGCQLYLGMTILQSAIERAHELNTGAEIEQTSRDGIVLLDAECSKSPNGEAVGWLRYGEQVDVLRTIRDAKLNTFAEVYSPRHGRNCWVAEKYLAVSQEVKVAPDPEITEADIALGLELYGCVEENVLADNCLAWGGEVYANLVLDVILPEIVEATSD